VVEAVVSDKDLQEVPVEEQVGETISLVVLLWARHKAFLVELQVTTALQPLVVVAVVVQERPANLGPQVRPAAVMVALARQAPW
jgi:hypothetical protein